jgi:cytochrome b561
MLIKNTNKRFGIIAILLHWFIALLMIGLVIVGLYMVELPVSLQKLKLYGWHKEYGFLVLALVFVRLIWRLSNQSPQLEIPILERVAARLVHWIFYLLMFALPITGWLITSAAGLAASFFGLFTLPNLIAPSEESRLFFQEVHKWLSYAFIGFLALHTAAALKHHFINRDEILRRMILP